MHRSALVFAFAVPALGLAPSEYFSAADASRVKSLITGGQAADGTFGSLSDSVFAVRALKLLGETVPKTSQLCDTVKQAASTENVADLYSAVMVSEALSCGVTVAEDKLSSALDSDELLDTYHAVRILSALKLGTLELLSPVVAKVAGLREEDGTFRGSDQSTYSSASNAGLAFELLADIALIEGISDEDLDEINTVVEAISDLMLLVEGQDVLAFADDESSIKATTLVLTGASKLVNAREEKLDIQAKQIVQFTEFFLQSKFVTGVEEAYYLLSGLSLMADNKIHVPLAISLVEKTLLGKGKETVKVGVTDILGKFVAPCTVTLTSAVSRSSEESVLEGKDLTPVAGSDTLYELDFLAGKPEQGYYTLELKVVPDGDSAIYTTDEALDAVERTVKVTGNVVVAGAEFASSGSEEAIVSAKGTALTYPKAMAGKVKLDNSKYVKLTFKLTSELSGAALQPHQVFVKFTNAKTEFEVVFLAKATDKGYNLMLDMSKSADEHFEGASGDYSVELIVGDSFLQNSFAWHMATVELDLPEKKKATSSSDPYSKENRAHHGAPTEKLPDIAHVYKTPEKRPPAIVSLVFAGLVLSPLLLLLGLIAGLGLSIKLPANPMFALGFQACLGLMIAVVGPLYFFKLNIFQTLACLSFLVVPSVFFGHKALRQHSEANSKLKSD